MTPTIEQNQNQPFLRKLIRRKIISANAENDGKLKRCLSTFDLTALGN